MPRFTADDIREAVSQNAFRRGEEYYARGRVVSVSVSADGLTVKAQVQGTERRPYRQTITIDEQDSPYGRISGACTCPMDYNCKHVAAALLAVLAGDRGRADERGGPRPGERDVPAAAAQETVSPEVLVWLNALSQAQIRNQEDYPEGVQQRLIYVLAPDPNDAGVPLLFVAPMSARLKKDGTFSQPASAYDLSNITRPNPAQFLRPSDRTILRKLYGLPRYWSPTGGVPLTGEEANDILRAIIATGRARLGGVNGLEVREGDLRPGTIAWRLLDDGNQRPVLALEDGLAAVRLAPPWWLDRSNGAMGPVDTGLQPELAAVLLSAPAVKPEEAVFVRDGLMQRIPAAEAPAPSLIEPPQRLREKAVPVLRLAVAPMPVRVTAAYGWRALYSPSRELVPTPVARLSFRYGPIDVGAHERGNVIRRARDGRLLEVGRNNVLERRSFAKAVELGLQPARLVHLYPTPPAEHADDFLLADDPGGRGWPDVLYHDVPALRAEGWIVEVADDFPVRLTVASGEIAVRLEESSGIDWFELDLGVPVDGERVDLVPALIGAITGQTFDRASLSPDSQDDQPLYLPLADGRILAVPFGRIRPMLAVLRELFEAGVIEPGAKRIGFSRFGAADLAALEESAGARALATMAGERLLALGRMLRNTGRIPEVPVPPMFRASLRPYQSRGVDWLQALGQAGIGGILADDMGLGKTVQALAHLAIEQAAGRLNRPALVVAPTSLVGNWRREAERFAPDLRVLTLHGPDRKAKFGDIARHDLVVTTYPLLARDQAELTAPDWSIVLLDEAHMIKNPDAITAKLTAKLRAGQRICLTGTPVENHLGELWSLFSFIVPGFLGDRDSFRRNYRTPIEKKGDVVRRQGLARRIKPFVLRRTKAEVAADLPPKTEIVERVEMESGQRAIYESIRLAMHDRVREAIAAKGLKRSSIVILDALLKMRQACCDPRLLKLKVREAHKSGSAKRERLMEIVPALVEEGRKILLFSQFTSMLALIEEDLEAAALPYVLLTGNTRDRHTPVQQFQGGQVPLFLISLKAGGVGLNLTAADTVIHYDPWWNPAVEDQANDRAHRIGQDKPVFVHKLMVTGSIEEKMEALKTRKRELVAGLFDAEAGGALDLTEADIEELFAAA